MSSLKTVRKYSVQIKFRCLSAVGIELLIYFHGLNTSLLNNYSQTIDSHDDYEDTTEKLSLLHPHTQYYMNKLCLCTAILAQTLGTATQCFWNFLWLTEHWIFLIICPPFKLIDGHLSLVDVSFLCLWKWSVLVKIPSPHVWWGFISWIWWHHQHRGMQTVGQCMVSGSCRNTGLPLIININGHSGTGQCQKNDMSFSSLPLYTSEAVVWS